MKTNDLKSLPDGELLTRLSQLIKESRRVESVIVAHIAEIDARRLYASHPSPSMFQYCLDALHLSEAEAYLRIEAARLSRQYPVILAMLEDGRVHLSGVAALAPALKRLDRKEGQALLARAAHKSKREVKELLVELEPKPDVAASIRKLPERRPSDPAPAPAAKPTPTATTSGRSSAAPTEPAPPPPSAPDPRKAVEPLAPERYLVKFTASSELRDMLERLQALMPGKELGEIMELVVREKLEKLESKRYGKTSKPRTKVEEADTSPGQRYISRAVRRSVWERDGGQCTEVATHGRRCPERHRLEYHHDKAYALGGDRSARNIRLVCRAHNLALAEKDFGREKMKRYQSSSTYRQGRPAPIVREPSPSFTSPLGSTVGRHDLLRVIENRSSGGPPRKLRLRSSSPHEPCNCCIIPAMSASSQSSAILPSTMR